MRRSFSTIDGGYTGTIDPFEGSHHLSIANDGTAAGFSGVFQRVAGTAGNEYEFSFQARSNSGAAFPIGAEFRLEFLDAGFNTLFATPNVAIAGSLTETYQPFSLSEIAPAGTAWVNPVIAVETFSASGTLGNLFVDGATLMAIPEPTSTAVLGLFGLAFATRRRRK